MDGEVANASWRLEDFVDSLVVELDKTRETLAVKALNRPLSYTVRELALDLNIFPSYDGDEVTFLTAQPGQQGASKVSIQLGTITDQQVRVTSKPPASKGEVTIDQADIDKDTKKKLRKIGVTNADDLKTIERKNVDIAQVENGIDYRKLANQIEKSRRAKAPPVVRAASLVAGDDDRPTLVIAGERLAINPRFPPVAVIDGKLAEVLSSSPEEIRVAVSHADRFARPAELVLTVDPFAVMRVNLQDRKGVQ
jgi:hypothetical protein